MSYNYGDYKQPSYDQTGYAAQPYPGAPSRNPPSRQDSAFEPPTGQSTRMNSFDPYSATSSRQQLNAGGMRYRDDVSAMSKPASSKPVPIDVEAAGGGVGVRRSASRFSPTTPMRNEKTDFRTWRSEFRDNTLWTRGGGVRCCARFCCCIILVVIFLIISIALTIALYIRPPNVTFDGVALDTAKGALDASTPGAFTINLKVSLTVANPNFFNAGFENIDAKAFYPLSGKADRAVGGGNKTNVVFNSDTTSNVDFPLAITYSPTVDPDRALILDIANRCGFNGGSVRDLPVKYTLTLKIKILVATISPSFNGNANFPCPADQLRLVVPALLGSGGAAGLLG